ncbi:small ribosomal subunit protein bS6m [Sagmatias obliquidens]|uniref:small ribosomal subunit protein bS6m n=1 Tax=Sagmatias obliquidens TaxID=3371155 RepID=UPI000F445F22|nr:28S ribosomal protein S6, mitochondrial [Lagenorhynchus obliquidens]
MSASKPVPDDEEEDVEKTVPENKLTSDNLEEESLPKVRQPARDGHDPNPAAHCLRLAPTSPQKGPREAAPAAALERRAVGKGARGSRPPSPYGRHGKFQLVRELYVASAAAAAAAGLEGACGWRWRFPAEPTVPPPAQHLRGQGGGSGGDRGRRGARLWRGAAQPPYRGGVAWPTGAWLAEGAWRPVCAAARALKPGLARPECAFAALEPSGPASCPVRAVPALLRPGSRLGSEPRAACSGMPRYELALILKAMQRPETAAALKRTLETLMDRGAVVRNLENLGERALPYRISAHSQQHTRGGYFLVDFYAPTTTVEGIMEHLSRDIDVIRPNIVKHPLTQEVKECEGIVPVPLEEKLYSTKKRK